MTDRTSPSRLPNGWRIAGWGALLALLALPAIAMQFSPGVDWTGGDFLFAAILLGLLGGGIELAFRIGRGALQSAAIAGFSILTFLTLWANMAVGIIGTEADAVNAGFTILALASILAALTLRFRARWMRLVCLALAIAPPALGLVASRTMPVLDVEWGILAALAALWLATAFLFHMARAD